VAYLEHLIGDLDRKIRRSHERLDQDKDEEPESPPIDTELAAKIAAISEREKALIDQMETLGEEGKIDELQNVKKHVDQLKQEKERLMSGQRPGQEKRMKVCEVCGAFLVIGDTEKRQQSHLEGKQHQGYLKIRQTIDEFKKLIDDRRRGRPEEKIEIEAKLVIVTVKVLVVEIEEEINIDIEALQEIKVKKVIALKIIKIKKKEENEMKTMMTMN